MTRSQLPASRRHAWPPACPPVRRSNRSRSAVAPAPRVRRHPPSPRPSRCAAGWSRAAARIAWRPLIQDQPVQAELQDRIDEVLEVNRLANVAVGAQTVAIHDVLLLL